MRLAVLTSGGDAPGMNAAVRAVVRRGLAADHEVLAVSHGYAGLLAGQYVPMTPGSVGDVIHRGGTILRSARSESFRDPAVRAAAIALARQQGIAGLVVVGGGGSLRGALAIDAEGLPTVGIAASIDNDVWGTDRAIGFDTAVNTVLDAINRVRDTASSHGRVFVIEVMGRDTGHIALAAGLAGGAESILIPEVPYDLAEVAERVRRGRERGKTHSIVVVAEGAGRAFDIGASLQADTGLETRVTVLGYIQRGGAPSAADRYLGCRLGAAAVDALAAGHHGVGVHLAGEEVSEVPLAEVASHRRDIDLAAYRLAAVLAQ